MARTTITANNGVTNTQAHKAEMKLSMQRRQRSNSKAYDRLDTHRRDAFTASRTGDARRAGGGRVEYASEAGGRLCGRSVSQMTG
eukprot:scaffold1177_cov126-Isochrysis_galbana.AAC.7